MNMTSLLLILFGFAFSALFSGVETGSYLINRVRLRHRERQRKASALVLSKLLRKSHIFIFTVLIGNNIAVFLVSQEVTNLYLAGGMQSGKVLLGFIPWNAEMAATLTLMFPLFLFAEVGPKNLFRKRADTLMYRCAGLMRLLVAVFYPFTWPLHQFFRLLTHGMDERSNVELHRLSPAGLKEHFSAGEREGLISSDQGRMLSNATSMHRISVRMLMTPFKKMPHLPDTATVADFKRLVARRDESYAVLLQRGSVVGTISMFTIISRQLADDAPLLPYAEDVLLLEAGRNLKSAFYRLRRNPRHRAVITDAHRRPIGFIRLEDIARYIALK